MIVWMVLVLENILRSDWKKYNFRKKEEFRKEKSESVPPSRKQYFYMIFKDLSEDEVFWKKSLYMRWRKHKKLGAWSNLRNYHMESPSSFQIIGWMT
jgi:hypothetical protein